MGKGATTGKAFLTGVLSKITDPELRAAAERVFANDVIAVEIGNGVEGQQEIDRRLQELTTQRTELETRAGALDQREAGLNTWHGNLQSWYQTNKDALEAAGRRGNGNPNPNPNPNPKPGAPNPDPAPAAGFLTLEQHQEALQQRDAAVLGFARDQNDLMRDHFGRFGEILHLEPLLQHPQITAVGLKGVYEIVHKERLDKHRADAQAAHDKKVADEAVNAYRQTQAQMPYPSVTGAGSGSPLDALQTQGKEPVVDAAVAHYTRLQAERQGAPGAS